MRLWMRIGLAIGLWATLGMAVASACKMAPPTPESLAAEAEMIVIATVSQADDDVATLEVESYVKGGGGDREIKLLNRRFDIGASCDLSLGAPARFGIGTRLVLFLGASDFEGPPWRVLGFDDSGAWLIIDDEVSVPENGAITTLSLLEAIDRLNNLVAGAPVSGPGGDAAVDPPVIVVDPAQPMPIEPGIGDGKPLVPVPDATPTPAGAAVSGAADAAGGGFMATTFPWVLVGVGVVAGALAFWGWRRERARAAA